MLSEVNTGSQIQTGNSLVGEVIFCYMLLRTWLRVGVGVVVVVVVGEGVGVGGWKEVKFPVGSKVES
jgi:hypothetical protein